MSGGGAPDPPALWPFRFPRVAASGSLPPEAAREPGHDPPDGLREEHGLDLPADEAQPVPEVRPHGGQAVLPAAGVEVAVAAAGEPAREREQDKRGVEFLPHAALPT